MKATTFDTVHVSDVHSDSGVSDLIRKTADALRAWNNRRIAIRELNTLTDRQLADIGLLRAEIPATVEKLLK